MDAGVLIGAAVTVAIGGIFPWINGEVVVAGAALLTPRAGLPVLVLACAAAQMSSKAILYGVIRWVPERMPARARRFAERVDVFRERRGLLVLAVLSGSSVALPPFYLVTLACGMLRVPFLLFAIGVLACSERGDPAAAAANAESEEVAEESEARVAPAFSLDRLGGGQVSLAGLRGKTVVIDFWATWCPPCEFQVPELNAFYQAHRADGDVEVLGISVDVEGPDVVSAWTGEKDVQYPILLGGEDLARKFGALGFPTLYIVAPDGTVDSEHIGLIEVGDLEEALARQRSGT